MLVQRTLAALIASAVLAPAFAAHPSYERVTARPNYTEPPIIVTEPRPSDDAINQNVVDVLSNDSRLAGRIGVQTADREVELTGIVTSWSQSLQAERDAKSVYGVRHVQNRLATRMKY